jgi:hypothetical protein
MKYRYFWQNKDWPEQSGSIDEHDVVFEIRFEGVRHGLVSDGSLENNGPRLSYFDNLEDAKLSLLKCMSMCINKTTEMDK